MCVSLIDVVIHCLFTHSGDYGVLLRGHSPQKVKHTQLQSRRPNFDSQRHFQSVPLHQIWISGFQIASETTSSPHITNLLLTKVTPRFHKPIKKLTMWLS